MKKIFISILICVLIILSACSKPLEVWDVNQKELKSKILNESEGNKISLSTYTNFKWDTLYEFRPYCSVEIIYEVIGYKFSDIFETVSENMNQIIFLNDSKVVCYLYGYPSNNKCGFYIPVEDDFTKIESKDNPVFIVKKYEYDDTKYVLLEFEQNVSR